MKKIIIIILLTISFQDNFACDICGCSSGNYFIGPLPQFKNYFLGTRYTFRSFKTVLNDDNSQYSNDFYQTIEVWGGLRLNNRLELYMFAPYNINKSVTDDGNTQNSGISDLTFIGNYNLLDKKYLNEDTETVSQQLWIGGGLKIPTGKFETDTSELISSANSQPGTGSFDFLINLTYTFLIKSWGFNSNINYKLNQEADNFKFGNRFSASGFVYRSSHLSKVILSPNIGILFENLEPDKILKEKVEDTGGLVLLSVFGIETIFSKIGIGMNVQLPIVQNLSNSQTNTTLRGMVHLSYLF
jgi:hypothetical protein